MAIHQHVRELLDLAREVAPKLAFANSQPGPTDPPSGDRMRARIEVAKQLDNLPSLAEVAATSCPTAAEEVIKLRHSLVAALHDPKQFNRLGEAYTALEVTAYRVSDGAADAQQAQPEKIFPFGRDGIKQDTIDIALDIFDSDEDTPTVRQSLARKHFADFDDCNARASKSLKDLRARESARRIILPPKRNKRNGAQ